MILGSVVAMVSQHCEPDIASCTLHRLVRVF